MPIRRPSFLWSWLPLALAFLIACAGEPSPAEIQQDITQKECDDLGDPYKGCPAFTPTEDNCKGPSAGKPWDKDGGWVNGQPICLGFGDKIGTCTKCNHLNVPNADYDKCLNQRFVACGKAGKLPGQAAAADMCFVTAAISIKCDRFPIDPDTKKPVWPSGDGSATAREMCFMKTPGNTAVSDCRKKAGCTTPGKKVGCTCEPCDTVAIAALASSTEDDVYAGSGSGSGDLCLADCEAALEDDPMCAPPPDTCPTPSPTPDPTPSPSPTATPSPTPDPTPSPSPTATPSPTPDPTPSPSPTTTPSPTPYPSPSPSPSATPSPTPMATPSPYPTSTPY